MSPHCLQIAYKQASETTLFANSPRPLLINGFSPLALVNERVHGHGDRTEPACPLSLSIGNCPKKDRSSPATETPGGLVMQGSTSYDCPSKKLKWDTGTSRMTQRPGLASGVSGMGMGHRAWPRRHVGHVQCAWMTDIVGALRRENEWILLAISGQIKGGRLLNVCSFR